MRLISILFLLLLIGVGGVYLFQKITHTVEKTLTFPPTGSPESPQRDISVPNGTTLEVTYNGESYRIHAVPIEKSSVLTLHPNFEQKSYGSDIMKSQSCTASINGGFYQPGGVPLGLFYSEGTQRGKLIQSNLVNGFFWETTDGRRYLSKQAPPPDESKFTLQTGPYILVDSYTMKLVADEPARRSLLGVDANDTLYMIAITDKENTFDGPYLRDIPMIFSQTGVQQRIPFRVLLNLDGGSASFFSSSDGEQTLTLSELNPIGSLLCMKIN